MQHFLRSVAVAALILLSNLLANHASSQKSTNYYSLQGHVTDSSGVPLAGASVYIPDLRKGSIADSTGQYSISSIPAGTYYVEVAFSGYKTVVLSLHFNKNIQKDFRLIISVTEEKEIVITGVSQATTLKRNPLPIVSVQSQFFQQNVSTNVISALSAVPGVSAVTTGPNVAKPFIRGLGYNRVVTLFDGIRLEGQQWGDEHGVEIDDNLVDRVEVVKGPASLLYGSDALAGVINMFPPQAPPQGVGRGNVSLEYQTNNNLLEGALNLAKHAGAVSWNLIGSQKMAADYQNRIDGRVYNTGFNQSSLFFQSTLHKSWGFSRIGVSYLNLLQEIPDGKRDSTTRKFLKPISDNNDYAIASWSDLHSYKISPVHQLVRNMSIYNSSSIAAGGGRIVAEVGFQKNIRKEFEDVESSDPALSLGLGTLTYDLKYLSASVGNFKFTGGVNGLYQINKLNGGSEFLIPAYHQFDLGPLLFSRYSSGKLEVDGGIRYDLRSIRANQLYVKEINGEQVPVYGADTVGATRLFSDYNHLFAGLSGSLGFSYRFDDRWNFKLNVARGYRAPNISEISSNGIHAGSQIYQLGNVDFKPEFSFQQDIGATFTSKHVTVTSDLFNNLIQNYIFNTKLVTAGGQDSVIVPGYETFRYTASRAHLWGGEFSVDVHPHPLDWLHFENSLSFVLARNLGTAGHAISDDEKYLPFIPPLHGSSELRANFREWKGLKNIFMKVQWEVFASQNRFYALNGTETATPGYQLLNLGAGADIKGKKGKPVLNITLLCNNLFNTAYQSNLSRLKYFEDYPNDPRGHTGIYEMGRNISLKISVPFGL